MVTSTVLDLRLAKIFDVEICEIFTLADTDWFLVQFFASTSIYILNSPFSII